MARKASYPIADIFINRWSSRALSDEPITDEALMPLFEAARWAPSAFNEQPWRFIYTHKGTTLWEALLASMVPVNRVWACNASVLVAIISKTFFDRDGQPNPVHSFDTGAAWMNLALQGSLQGLVIHAIGGFDIDMASAALQLPSDFKVELLVAIGKPGDKKLLSPELQAREVPNDRKPLAELVFKDEFKPKKS